MHHLVDEFRDVSEIFPYPHRNQSDRARVADNTLLNASSLSRYDSSATELYGDLREGGLISRNFSNGMRSQLSRNPTPTSPGRRQ
jgi:hypothetical protein